MATTTAPPPTHQQQQLKEHNNIADNSLELFQQSWRAYRCIVDCNYMDHQGLTEAVSTLLPTLLTPPPKEEEQWMVDLGVGDLGLLAPILRPLPLSGFIGVDAAAEVLPLASKNLGPTSFPCEWTQADILAWAEERSHLSSSSSSSTTLPKLKVVTCFFALHHLEDSRKQQVLAALLPCMASSGGSLLVADVFRNEGEAREPYMTKYRERIAGWEKMCVEDRQLIDAHVSSSDFPSEREIFRRLAAEVGWESKWVWRGCYGAEALLLLQPKRQ